jgi:hypothetical protein
MANAKPLMEMIEPIDLGLITSELQKSGPPSRLFPWG